MQNQSPPHLQLALKGHKFTLAAGRTSGLEELDLCSSTSSISSTASKSYNRWSRYLADGKVTLSSDTLPSVFQSVPLTDEPSCLKLHKPIRVIALCQALSIEEGGDNATFHMTAHPRYTIKVSTDEHSHREIFERMGKVTKVTVATAETAGGFATNISHHPGNMIRSGYTSFQRTVNNRPESSRHRSQ
jgi:hypothetical protein